MILLELNRQMTTKCIQTFLLTNLIKRITNSKQKNQMEENTLQPCKIGKNNVYLKPKRNNIQKLCGKPERTPGRNEMPNWQKY